MFKLQLICQGKKNKVLNVSEETTIETIKKKLMEPIKDWNPWEIKGSV